MPIAPAPTIAMERGSSRARICVSYVTMFSLSSTPGSSFTREPVAMMAFANVSVSVEPSAFATSIVLASRNVPRPSNSVMPFFFIR